MEQSMPEVDTTLQELTHQVKEAMELNATAREQRLASAKATRSSLVEAELVQIGEIEANNHARHQAVACCFRDRIKHWGRCTLSRGFWVWVAFTSRSSRNQAGTIESRGLASMDLEGQIELLDAEEAADSVGEQHARSRRRKGRSEAIAVRLSRRLLLLFCNVCRCIGG